MGRGKKRGKKEREKKKTKANTPLVPKITSVADSTVIGFTFQLKFKVGIVSKKFFSYFLDGTSFACY
jgi:hypothetical protein